MGGSLEDCKAVGYNRTYVELKLGIPLAPRGQVTRYNRTYVELKRSGQSSADWLYACYNRTYVELKLQRPRLTPGRRRAIIVLM